MGVWIPLDSWILGVWIPGCLDSFGFPDCQTILWVSRFLWIPGDRGCLKAFILAAGMSAFSTFVLPGEVLPSDIGDRGNPFSGAYADAMRASIKDGGLLLGRAVVLGCSRSVLTTEQSAALAEAEERWKRSGPRDYSFEFHPFNGLAFGECAARIEVRGGVVKEVTRLGSLDPGSTTIDGLFQSIRAAEASGHYAKIEAHYDRDFGYPTRIVFTTIKDISDGNAIIEVRAFKNLAGQ